MNVDLTSGKPGKVLWKFCLPLFGSVLFQQLYNIADSFVAGRYIGEQALAAVGNSYEITLIFIAFAFGCNMGCSVLSARLFGARDYQGLKTAVNTSMVASLVTCLSLMVLGLVFGGWLLELIQTPENVMADSKLYLDIYLLGLPFLFFYNLSTGIFSALGDSKTPFYFLAVSSLSNIFVDILFVTKFHMGVSGVAWATFLCQGVSCILAVTVVMKRMKAIPAAGKAPLFSPALFRQFAAVAIPSTLQQSFISVGNILIQGVINGFGSGVMAGYSAAIKLNSLVLTSLTTIGNGISNYTAQNLGAGRQERIALGFRAGLKMVWLLCLPIILLYELGGNLLISLFMEAPSQEALSSGMAFLRIVSPFYAVIAVKLVADGILRGSARMKAFMICTFTDLFLRVILAYILPGFFGSLGVWLSWPLGWVVAAVLSVYYYSKYQKEGAVHGTNP